MPRHFVVFCKSGLIRFEGQVCRYLSGLDSPLFLNVHCRTTKDPPLKPMLCRRMALSGSPGSRLAISAEPFGSSVKRFNEASGSPPPQADVTVFISATHFGSPDGITHCSFWAAESARMNCIRYDRRRWR